MAQDLYNPDLQNTNIGDSLSDTFLGTNNKEMKNITNSYELDKAKTINKFGWNKQGMVDAGINPLINPQGLNGVSSGSSSNMSKSTDLLSRTINKCLGVVGKQLDKGGDAAGDLAVSALTAL